VVQRLHMEVGSLQLLLVHVDFIHPEQSKLNEVVKCVEDPGSGAMFS
jgi:hypothetical protein